MTKQNVLISLHKGYGLGDAVQMSAVLRHVVQFRPDWHIDYQAEEGRHQVGRDIVASTFAYGQPYPSPHYDAEVQICLYDTWSNWADRPNTRVSSCLHEHFDVPWDASLGRYQVAVSPEAAGAAAALTVGKWGVDSRKYTDHPRWVAVHYQGDSSPTKKNLTHEQAWAVCKRIEHLGCTPLLLDWRNVSPLVDRYDLRTTGRIPLIREWGASAEMNCAVIRNCEAFVGIDSGPSKCASATDIPALVVWTGHHPAPYHDPAPNTTHLVPRGYHSLKPVCDDPGVIEFFEEHYQVRQYGSDLVTEIGAWLEEVLDVYERR